MVLFFESKAVTPAAIIYMGKDKVENEDLIKYAWPQDVWFHVDKLSSAHVYLRMPEAMTWEAIPEALLNDCAQLVKANSIEGNKKDNITIIYTPGSNLKKSGDMAVGQVSFHNDKKVKRVHVPTRENVIVNRLNKTKVIREVDHEKEKVDRIKAESAIKRAVATQKRKDDLELAKAREAHKVAWSYDSLHAGDGDGEYDYEVERPKPKSYNSIRELEDDFM
ncbi:DUF814-domain-containing protein [Pterulicium gracile]|uniref:DUF814-domain-containing protein n=1 Tax=Pterulicium gracile TaxID=1884261 RepID=A0A5C3QGV4_9AGAR|nr:DUF814-domain-containing protein [Pterula gracilis]